MYCSVLELIINLLSIMFRLKITEFVACKNTALKGFLKCPS